MADTQFYDATRPARESAGLRGLYSAAQVRGFDERAIAQGVAAGVAGGGYGLMQRAAAAAIEALRDRWPHCKRVIVLAGPGNNGGDGVELARQLLDRSSPSAAVPIITAEIWLLGDPDNLSGEARAAYDAWVGQRQAQLSERPGRPELPELPELPDIKALDLPAFSTALADANANECVVIDALFGTGLSRPVEGVALAGIDAVNASTLPVLAIDIPSGLHADSGGLMPRAIRADCTVTMIAETQGLWLGDGPEYCGACVHADLGVPAEILAGEQAAIWRMTPQLLDQLPKRHRNFHKGDAGRVAVIGGQPGMPGAVLLAARAALRAGSGLVRVFTHADHAAQLPMAQAELMSIPLDDKPELAAEDLSRVDAIALGPGLGQGDWGRRVFEHALGRALESTDAGETSPKLVIDADALNMLARDGEKSGQRRLPPETVLTPHPGEAARLLGCASSEIQADRVGSVRALVERYGCVVVLKGAGTLVGAPGVAGGEPQIVLCPYGNPGMATGGMGDVLTGVVASLLGQGQGQGLDAFDAAKLGVLWHAVAGDAAARPGREGLLPSDLIDALRGTR